jgi:hypothetical protein
LLEVKFSSPHALGTNPQSAVHALRALRPPLGRVGGLRSGENWRESPTRDSCSFQGSGQGTLDRLRASLDGPCEASVGETCARRVRQRITEVTRAQIGTVRDDQGLTGQPRCKDAPGWGCAAVVCSTVIPYDRMKRKQSGAEFGSCPAALQLCAPLVACSVFGHGVMGSSVECQPLGRLPLGRLPPAGTSVASPSACCAATRNRH